MHIVAAISATHKHRERRVCPRGDFSTCSFTPPLSYWLNLVERFIRDGAGTIGGASFASVRELADTISAREGEMDGFEGAYGRRRAVSMTERTSG